MIISHSLQFIFLKTRKTAGSSFEQYIFKNHFDSRHDVLTGSIIDKTPTINLQYDLKGHVSWNVIKSLYRKEWLTYQKIAIERNPWDKAVSQFWFHQELMGSRASAERSLQQFNTDFLSDKQRLPTDWYRYSDDNGPRVDEFLIYDQLEEHLSVFLASRGLSLNLNMWRGTRLKAGLRQDKHYREMYTKEGVEVIRSAFGNEIDYFGFKY